MSTTETVLDNAFNLPWQLAGAETTESGTSPETPAWLGVVSLPEPLNSGAGACSEALEGSEEVTAAVAEGGWRESDLSLAQRACPHQSLLLASLEHSQ